MRFESCGVILQNSFPGLMLKANSLKRNIKVGKPKNNQNGFSAIEALLILIILGIVGFTGYFVWHARQNADKSLNSNNSTTPVIKKKATKTSTAQSGDSYTGWKTYTSPLKSGLSFKYPADWQFPNPATAVPAPNNLGGVENDSVVYSALPQGGPFKVTNQYMCVSIDEYSDSGWGVSNWTLGKELSSEQVTLGGKTATLSTYAGSTPMQSQLILHNPNVASGNHFIATKNNYVVSVEAAFNNCQQPADNEGITNKQADFNQQPETDIARKIIKSIQF